MPYGTTVTNPYADYVANFTSPDGVIVSIQILSGLAVGTETERDDTMQTAIDALAALSGWTFNDAVKNSTANSTITVTS